MSEYVCKDKFFSFKQTLGQRGVFEHKKPTWNGKIHLCCLLQKVTDLLKRWLYV